MILWLIFNKIFIFLIYCLYMIRVALGIMLILVSCLSHSTLYSERNLYVFRVRQLIAFFSAIVVLLVVEGALGLAIKLFNLNPVYHNVIVFSIILLTLICHEHCNSKACFKHKLEKGGIWGFHLQHSYMSHYVPYLSTHPANNDEDSIPRD